MPELVSELPAPDPEPQPASGPCPAPAEGIQTPSPAGPRRAACPLREQCSCLVNRDGTPHLPPPCPRVRGTRAALDWATRKDDLCTRKAPRFRTEGAVQKRCCTDTIYTWETMNLDPHLIQYIKLNSR